MNLNQLPGNELLNKTKNLVKEERLVTLLLIEHLREIERRMLYAELGFGSLFEFCVKCLGLSEGSAQRRISAMRLARDVKGVKEKLESGALSLSNAAKIQIAFNKVKYAKAANIPSLSQNRKVQIVEECTSKSQAECEKTLFTILPEYKKIESLEKERKINTEEVELKIVLSKELQIKIKKLKDYLSHAGIKSTLDLIEHLIDKELRRQEKKKGLSEIDKPNKDLMHSLVAAVPIPKINVKKEVYRRAKAKCEFPGCISTSKLEIDHIYPKALGGKDELENLRLLCRVHNTQQAQVKLGFDIMKKYVPSLR